jgi:hypothetical protein
MNRAQYLLGICRAGVVVAVLLLCGCPFSSDTPLADPTTGVKDKDLAGTWQMRDPESGELITLSFHPFNEHEYVAVSQDAEKLETYRVFATTVSGERFLNVRQIDSDDTGWYFARYQLNGSQLFLRFVDDGLFRSQVFAAPIDLHNFVRDHIADPLLYAPADDDPMDSVWDRVPDQK